MEDKRMKKARMLLCFFCFIFLTARPALANISTGPFTFFLVIMLVPIFTIIASQVGGAYAVLGVMKGEKAGSARIKFVIPCIAVFVISLVLYAILDNPFFEFGILGVAIATVVYAIIRGVKMSRWGFQKKKGVEKDYLKDAKSTRLIVNGLWLVIATLCVAAYNGHAFMYEMEINRLMIKQMEVRENFAIISEYEEDYYDTHHTYISDIDTIDQAIPLTSNYYEFEIIYADDMGFLAVAWGNIDDDEYQDILIITEDRHELFTYMSDLSDSEYSHYIGQYIELRDVYREHLDRFIEDISTGEG